MADKLKSPSSLFAGMNMDEGRQPRSPISSVHYVNIETKLSEGTNTKDSKDKVSGMLSSGVSGGSSFSFIRQSEAVEQANDPKVDINCKVSGDEQKPKTTQLDPFEMLDESDSISGDENKLLSYSDQLAEILPMANSTDETLMTLPDSPTVNGDHEADLPLQDDGTQSQIGQLSQDISQDKNSILGTGNKKNEDEITASPNNKNFQCTKYNLVLEPEDEFSLFLSQHSFQQTKLRDEKDELQRNLCLVYEDVKNKIVSLKENLNRLRIKFDEALYNDDYDLAADINEKIEQLTTEKCELQSTRPSVLNIRAKDYLNQIAVFVEKEKSFHQWALTKYRDLEKEQSNMLTEHRKNCTKEVDAKKQDLKCQKDELNRLLEHLQLDREYNEKDRSELDLRIDAKLEGFLDKKNELVEKRRGLQNEMEELEKRLNELKTETEGVESAIKNEEEKMEEARKEFEPLETKIKDKSYHIRTEEDTLKLRLEQVELRERDLDLVASQNNKKEESFVKNISYLITNRKESETLIQSSPEEVDKKMSDVFLAEQSEEGKNDLKNLRIREKEKAADLQDFELQVFNKEQKVLMKKKRLEEIASQLPEFEKAKKMAVTAKLDFDSLKDCLAIIAKPVMTVETLGPVRAIPRGSSVTTGGNRSTRRKPAMFGRVKLDNTLLTCDQDHNFKEAKRLNEIVKQLSGEVESTKADVQDVEENLRKDREKVAAMKDDLEKMKKEVLTARESHDLLVCKRIVNRIAMLVQEGTRIRKDSLVETLREAELDLLKTEFGFLDISSESVISKMTDADQKNLVFVKELLKQET